MLYSFDIFDTLITRKTLTPRGVFLVVQKKLSEKKEYGELSQHFASLRFEAEHMAEKYVLEREITLDDIYDVLSKRCHLSKEEVETLKSIEIGNEIECAYPMTNNINLLKEKITEGHRVVLISDMYLPEKHIRKILCKIDTVFSDIPIYVSGDCNATKKTGALFSYVKEKEGIDYSNWTHYGDNIISDYNVPRFLGIKAVLTKGYELDQIERTISNKYQIEKSYDAQIFLGLVKIICMGCRDYARKMGALCGGAILLPYAKWILDECNRQNIENLVFMSRDGYIIKKIADLLIKNNNIDIKSSYAYVSRKVLRDKGDLRKTAIEYLKELIGDKKSAIVDFHGTGKSLKNIAQEMNSHVLGFYYLLDGSPKAENVSLYGYTYVSIFSGMLEIFCRAPHGVVEGYKRDGIKIEPCLSNISEELWEQSGIYSYIDGALEFASEYDSLIKNGFYEADLNDFGKEIIWYCENTPDDKTAEFIGDFPHSENNSGEMCGFAPKLSEEKLREIYGKRGDEILQSFYEGTNIEYSVRRSGENYKKLIKASVTEENVHKESDKERIIVYAAGRYGYEAYYRFMKSRNHEVVAWIDMNYQSCDSDLVQSPSVVKDVKFDKMIICLNNRKLFEDVSKMMCSIGIPQKKIMWICDYWPDFFV